MARILIHPGDHLADELKALGMSANEMAKQLGVPRTGSLRSSVVSEESQEIQRCA